MFNLKHATRCASFSSLEVFLKFHENSVTVLQLYDISISLSMKFMQMARTLQKVFADRARVSEEIEEPNFKLIYKTKIQ